MSQKALLSSLLVATSFACGGPEKPAEVPDPVISAPTAAPHATGGPAKASPAQATITKGTKALEANDLPGAKTAFEAALKQDPESGEALYYLGVVAEKQNDKAGAERNYRAALGKRPDLVEAATNLGALLIDSGQIDDAIAVLRKAATLRKDQATLHANLALALAMKGGAEAEAARSFDEAVKLAPKDAMVLLTYGQWLGKWKQNEQAVAKLKAARDAASGDLGVLASVGFELKNVGAFKDCIATLDQAIGQKDAAELRTYRALCKLGAEDKAGATTDLKAATTSDAKYGPAHFYLGGRYAEEGKRDLATKEYEAYLKLEPKGPLASKAEERIKILAKKK
ncbi:MAG: tetratricopeptide repeat protein [Polyangiaceae bacterium]